MRKSQFLMGLSVVAGIAVAATGIAGAQDAIKARKDMMKNAGGSMKVLVPMNKGEAPFEAAKAQEALTVLIKAGDEFHKLFPAGSDKGGDTEAKPEIWKNLADFETKSKAMTAAAKAAHEAAGKGADAFKASFGAVGKSCGDCHQAYRVKKN